MKFPLFRRETSKQAIRERQDQAEKMLADGLRALGQLCAKLADLVDAQRLERAGYAEQEKFLERLDKKR